MYLLLVLSSRTDGDCGEDAQIGDDKSLKVEHYHLFLDNNLDKIISLIHKNPKSYKINIDIYTKIYGDLDKLSDKEFYDKVLISDAILYGWINGGGMVNNVYRTQLIELK